MLPTEPFILSKQGSPEMVRERQVEGGRKARRVDG